MDTGGPMFYGSITFILDRLMKNVYLIPGSFLAMFNLVWLFLQWFTCTSIWTAISRVELYLPAFVFCQSLQIFVGISTCIKELLSPYYMTKIMVNSFLKCSWIRCFTLVHSSLVCAWVWFTFDSEEKEDILVYSKTHSQVEVLR